MQQTKEPLNRAQKMPKRNKEKGLMSVVQKTKEDYLLKVPKKNTMVILS